MRIEQLREAMDDTKRTILHAVAARDATIVQLREALTLCRTIVYVENEFQRSTGTITQHDYALESADAALAASAPTATSAATP